MMGLFSISVNPMLHFGHRNSSATSDDHKDLLSSIVVSDASMLLSYTVAPELCWKWGAGLTCKSVVLWFF